MSDALTDNNSLFLILGNQLVPPKHLSSYKNANIFMAESYDLCIYEKHHKQKIVLFLSAMRNYRDELKKKKFNIHYVELSTKNKKLSFEDLLSKQLKKYNQLVSFEIEDKFFEKRIKKLCATHNIPWKQLRSPLFLTSREEFKSYLKNKKRPFMKTFYEGQRKQLGILLDQNGYPEGGQWSYDEKNRKKLPKTQTIPPTELVQDSSRHIQKIKNLVEKEFPSHPGQMNSFWAPTTRKQYLRRIDQFIQSSLPLFGKYQDAITPRDPFLFHSLLSPGLNLGLITPDEVVHKLVAAYNKNPSPALLYSVEGFIRQIIGWREFVRGIYQNYSEKQFKQNFWNHQKKMRKTWYTGKTGLPPVDDAIQRAQEFGYCHHIDRLMVLSNVMFLCEIKPLHVYRWFMEMFIDSSDWVMAPNVFGMGQFSDGGIFATKPYICGSNYILKMSDYKKDEWCDVMDGLYWRFVSKNKSFFAKNPRMKMMLGGLDRMESGKKKRIFALAEEFIEKNTH